MQNEYLYEQLAGDLAALILQGNYGVAERLPSLRQVSEQYGVSLATAVQAYRRLEQQGLIEARPKTGYFVLPLPLRSAAPEISRPSLVPTRVNVGQMAMSLVHESRQAGLVKLGAAVPGPEMQPLGVLSRTMAGVARRYYQAASGYESAQGHAALRKQIAHLMRDAGVRVHPDEIIITNGCLEALHLALRAVAAPGDTIAIESPTYFGVLQVIENLGMQALELPTHARDGLEAGALQRAIRRRKVKACVLMPCFNNPLGSNMPEDNKQHIVKMLAEAGIPLIEDDMYGFLSHTLPRPKAAKAYDQSGNVLYCSSFSKTVAPGLRIGWIIAGNFLEQVKYQKFLDNISTAVHPQLTMAEFLARGSFRRHTRHVARIYRQRMEQLRRGVAEHFPAGTRMSAPTGGFLLWVELAKKHNSYDLYRRALEKRIAITPGMLFSAQKQYRHHLRLSCGAVEGEKARRSIRKLGCLLN